MFLIKTRWTPDPASEFELKSNLQSYNYNFIYCHFYFISNNWCIICPNLKSYNVTLYLVITIAISQCDLISYFKLHLTITFFDFEAVTGLHKIEFKANCYDFKPQKKNDYKRRRAHPSLWETLQHSDTVSSWPRWPQRRWYWVQTAECSSQC